MNENIDLTKILKNCNKGTKFYSVVHGDIEFVTLLDLNKILFTYKDGQYYYDLTIQSDGKLYNNGECIIFPSKYQRDWSKFSISRYKKKFDPKTLKPFDKVLVKCTSIYNSNLVWRVGVFSYFYVADDSIRVYTLGSDDNAPNSYVIPYNDETKHLVNTTEEAPEYYRYWDD